MPCWRADPGMVTCVAFDLMDTVLHDPYREALAAATGGMSLQELNARRDPTAYPRLERGEISEDEYWRLHAAVGIPVDRRAFHETRRAGYTFVPGMAALVAEVRAVARAVAASNYPRWLRELEEGLLQGRFDAVYGSHELGIRKPDRAFFTALLDRLGIPADQVVMVDDRPRNVEGARAAGLRGVRFTDADELREQLVELGLAL